MPETFFIADTHFGHKGIITFSETKPFRPFNTIEEHDEELIKRWNSVIGKKDNVWHLGDVVFGARNLPILERLNGYKRLVLGNHDVYGIEEYSKYFAKIFGIAEYKGMILTHAPIHPNQLNRWYLNVHGHMHTKDVIETPSSLTINEYGQSLITESVLDKRYINVSCEKINLTPVPLDWIHDKWAERN